MGSPVPGRMVPLRLRGHLRRWSAVASVTCAELAVSVTVTALRLVSGQQLMHVAWDAQARPAGEERCTLPGA
jgi:hypothetical protein